MHVIWAALCIRAWRVGVLAEWPLLTEAEYFGIRALWTVMVIVATESLLWVADRTRFAVRVGFTARHTFAF